MRKAELIKPIYKLALRKLYLGKSLGWSVNLYLLNLFRQLQMIVLRLKGTIKTFLLAMLIFSVVVACQSGKIYEPTLSLEAKEIAAIKTKVGEGLHPNTYIDAKEIAAIRTRVEAGEKPWKTAYEKMLLDANKALSVQPYSVTKNGGPKWGHDFSSERPYCGWKRVDGKKPDCRDGQINPEADRRDYEEAIALGNAVRDLGLAYAFTQDSKYADKGISLIRVWCLDKKTRMNPTFTNPQSQIELSITLPGMFYGADLLYNYSGWSAKEKKAFEDWVSAITGSAQYWSRTNNFENWRVNFIASAGSLIKNESLLNYAFARYKELIPIQMDEQGKMKKEIGRTKSLFYSLYAINAMTQVAEIARHYDVNLYDYTNESRGLKLAVDYYAPYAANPDSWDKEQIAPLKETDSVALYELAYSYWQEPAYLKVINYWGRPMIEKRILGDVSLTHANSFELDIEKNVANSAKE
ncbi:MAG: alginate lyase family protein [Coleofasciculaceae cyanobacterium]